MSYHKNLCDLTTGEMLGEGDFISKEEGIKKEEARRQQLNGYEYYRNNILPLPTLLQQEYGNFIHTRYQALLDKLNNDTATAFRFIYLCTYMDYDTGYILWKNEKIKSIDLRRITFAGRFSK